ncbi:MAG: IucA/IucC family C-terminal-domain containing protein [Acidimicrobiales bacterium]
MIDPGPDEVAQAEPKVLDGDEAREALTGALARVAECVSYLRATIDPDAMAVAGHSPANGEWMACAELLEDPAWLGEVIRVTGAGLGTQDPAVATSLFVQGYAYRVLTLSVACLTTTGLLPDASAPRLAIGITRNRPSSVAYLQPSVRVLGAPGAPGFHSAQDVLGDEAAGDLALGLLVEQAIDNHLRLLVAAARRAISHVGERLLWGNVAASAATAFRTMDGCLGDWVQPLGERFFTLAPGELQGLGAFVVMHHQERRGWFWERTNCCLYDRLPGDIRCADCSRTPMLERRAAYLETLRAR